MCFLDAIPADTPARVDVDVLTPHVKAYYESTAAGQGTAPVPPAEYHNPVPVNFLTVGGAFAVDLYGTRLDDVEQAADWLKAAGDELGAGGKTAAGYGYLAVTGAARAGPGVTVHVISVGLSILDALEEPRRAFRDTPDLAAAVRKEEPGRLLEKACVHNDKTEASGWLARALAPADDAARDPSAAGQLAAMARGHPARPVA